MQKVIGNIWDLSDSHWIIIPTNYGWTRRGANVMGRGLAKQAALKYPHIPLFYGKICRDMAYSVTLTGSYAPLPFVADTNTRLIFFVVKPLNKDAPNLSWQLPATLPTIEASLRCLIDWMYEADKPLVAMPLVGCGNGGLDPKVVVPVLEDYLKNFDNVVLVYPGEKSSE